MINNYVPRFVKKENTKKKNKGDQYQGYDKEQIVEDFLFHNNRTTTDNTADSTRRSIKLNMITVSNPNIQEQSKYPPTQLPTNETKEDEQVVGKQASEGSKRPRAIVQ